VLVPFVSSESAAPLPSIVPEATPPGSRHQAVIGVNRRYAPRRQRVPVRVGPTPP